jgi:2'-5' RNA ligase
MRTFIELAIPGEVRDHIRHLQDGVCRVLAQTGADACFRWTQMTSVHLTLRFLGETTEDQQEQLSDGLKGLAEEWAPISLGIGSLGGFPSVQRPRVLWLGITGDVDGLQRLQAAVEGLVQTCGFETDIRPYSPHLTIARTKRDCPRSSVQKAGQTLSEYANKEYAQMNRRRFLAMSLVHMRSDLRPTGAVYTPLSTHALSA